MASMNDRNVAGLYAGKESDYITFKLHSNDGYEVVWCVWEDKDGYHVFAEPDDSTEDFLTEHYPDELDTYHQAVESIPTGSAHWLATINSHISHYTYNSIRPLVENEDAWLELNEEELDRD
jgi:hypothetical protein